MSPYDEFGFIAPLRANDPEAPAVIVPTELIDPEILNAPEGVADIADPAVKDPARAKDPFTVAFIAVVVVTEPTRAKAPLIVAVIDELADMELVIAYDPLIVVPGISDMDTIEPDSANDPVIIADVLDVVEIFPATDMSIVDPVLKLEVATTDPESLPLF